MYFHIYVEHSCHGQVRTCYDKNLTEKYIIENYVYPFKKHETVYVAGEVVNFNNIIVFKLLKSEKILEDIVNESQSKIPSNVIIIVNDEDVLKEHNASLIDVTNQFLQNK